MARTEITPPRPPAALEVCSRQKARRLNLPRGAAMDPRAVLEEWPGPRAAKRREARPSAGGQLGVYFIHAAEMARLNEQFLGHAGSTDVHHV